MLSVLRTRKRRAQAEEMAYHCVRLSEISEYKDLKI